MNTRIVLKPLLLAAVSAISAGPSLAQVPDVARGRLLYENHCVVCHTQKVHRRTPPMPMDVQDLRRIVSSWAKEQNLRWSQADIEDVVHYLDRTHYQLGR